MYLGKVQGYQCTYLTLLRRLDNIPVNVSRCVCPHLVLLHMNVIPVVDYESTNSCNG